MNVGLPRRILAIGAHPDDVEVSCAGTLARFVHAGCSVRIAVVCRGDRGGTASPTELAARRREEAERSASILGVEVSFLDIGDSEVRDTPEIRAAFLRLLRDARPDLLISHAPDDYHDDHVQVSQLAAKCAWYAASPGHRTDSLPLDRPPALAYMDNLAGLGPDPSHLVDISRTIDLKRSMLACHVSQSQRQDGRFSELEELAETLARLRGFQCGVRYAEGFRVANLWGRRRPEPLFP